MDVGRVTELVVLRVPGMFGRGQGFGELKLRARPSPGVCDSVNTEPQLVTHGEAGEDGTGKKKVLLGKGETVQVERGCGRFHCAVHMEGGHPCEGEGSGWPRQWFPSQPRGHASGTERSHRQMAWPGWAFLVRDRSLWGLCVPCRPYQMHGCGAYLCKHVPPVAGRELGDHLGSAFLWTE